MNDIATRTIVRDSYRLEDALQAQGGQIFLTGTQALVRLPLMQRQLDAAAGLNTAGFISGYRGSPLGGYDLALWRAGKQLDAANIRFLPAINEEAGATAVLGSQQVESDPQRTVDGVFAIWYGKGPGVDRAADALHHGNAYGSSPRGGVLVVAGDDHGCVSSSMPHQSDFVMQAWGMPIVNPANVAEMLEFGLYGWALSRYCGAWVGFKAISETVESAMTVDLDTLAPSFTTPEGFAAPSGGLHFRPNDNPSPAIELRLAAKLEAAKLFARANSIDKLICAAPAADIGIVTCGKAHFDLMETFRRLGLSLAELDAQGVRIYKVGLSFPLETGRMDDFCKGLKEVLVIEEKGAVVEQQMRSLFYNRAAAERPAIIGKTDASGCALLAATGELRPSRVMPVVAQWLAGHKPALDRRELVVDFTAPEVLSNIADTVKRIPYFCSGCPHNSSTRVPEGSVASPGIGCHYMASWMNRDTAGAIQMGGEGIDWAAHGLFTKRHHMFQNLGDGTYFHSGILAIRQAIAAKANITYKILFNDAVAMTGGQPPDGSISVAQMARQVEAEGARRVVIVSDYPEKYVGQESDFPKGTRFHHRSELDPVQRTLREVEGVTVLIYEQVCATEKRRRRKKGTVPLATRRVFINAEVCEGCGDCGNKSNCLSVLPLETPLGRKRIIDQASCNQDYSCVDGFCPSFVSIIGGKPRRGAMADLTQMLQLASRLPMPTLQLADAPYDILVTGVGGTGVVTIGALITMAAHLDGHSASVLDFMGFAQKGGAVLSFVRLAASPDLLNQARIDTQQADMMLACDMVVGAGEAALQTVRRGRTRLVVNSHEIPTDVFVRNPDADLHGAELLEKMRFAAGPEQMNVCDGNALASQLLGDAVGTNILLMGHAWQLGLIPVSLAAIERAIELNGVAVDMNRLAFHIGRLAAADPAALAKVGAGDTAGDDSLSALIETQAARLAAYQNAAYAQPYRQLLARVQKAEQAMAGSDPALPLSRAVAINYAKLLAVKDEYEVARLYTDGTFAKSLANAFEGDYRIQFHLAPPLLAGVDAAGKPRKRSFGQWMLPAMRALAAAKGLRGSVLDIFGYSAERRLERQLAKDYAALIEAMLPRLDLQQLPTLLELANLPQKIRGYGHVKLASIEQAKVRENELRAQAGLAATIARPA
ncbi:MAG: indolepyruvate ferredoxin oxidoreductase family protein [Burkholderiaceae bacterium]|nr:indolepyruvate ferredoxin oxidoreductase family protein [Sulfuritalea sp.]MCF8175539.1 indolepyruvate ferredoxin oxidoreductase family protein [Burkholderiaceae bacterium]